MTQGIAACVKNAALTKLIDPKKSMGRGGDFYRVDRNLYNSALTSLVSRKEVR